MGASARTPFGAASTSASERSRFAHKAKPRTAVRGFLFLASARSVRRGRGECRNRHRKLVKELDQARMILPPRAGEATITVAEHAGTCDLSDVLRRCAARCRGVHGTQPA